MQSHQLATPHWNLLLNGCSPKSQCSLTSLLDIASIKQNHIDGRLWKLPTGNPMHLWCWLHTHPYFPPVNCTLQRHGLFRRQFLQRILTFDSFTWVGSWPKQMCIVTFLPSAKKTMKKKEEAKSDKSWTILQFNHWSCLECGLSQLGRVPALGFCQRFEVIETLSSTGPYTKLQKE